MSVQGNIDVGPNDHGNAAAGARRRLRRLRALHKVAGRQAELLRSRAVALRAALRSAGLLALVGLVLFSPLLLDDIVFRASYLMRPSEDSILIDAPALLSDQPGLTLRSGILSMPPALSGKARTGEALAALVKGGTARLALKNPVFVLRMANGTQSAGAPAAGEGLVEDLLPATLSPLIEALQNAAFETLMIRDGTLILDLGDGRTEELRSLDADVSIKRRTATRFKGSVTLRGEPLAFDVVLGGRIERRGAVRIPLKGRVESGLFQANLDGRLDIDRGVALAGAAAEITIGNVRSVARWLGHTWPSGSGLKDFLARGTLDWSGTTLAMSRGRYWLDGNEASGTMSVSLAPDRSLVAGTLAFGKIDLTPYFPAPTASAGAGEVAAKLPLLQALKATSDVRWPLIGAVDADLRLSAEQVRIGSFETQRAAASLTMNNGQVLFNVAEVQLADGGLGVGEFGISGSASHPNFTVRGRLEDVELGPVSSALFGIAAVRARGQVSLDATASGSVGIDVLSRLNGKIEAQLGEGGTIACSHVSVAAAIRANRPASELCGSSLTIAPTALRAQLSNGLLIANGLEVIAGDDAVRLSGTVDLVASGVDIAVRAGPQKGQRAESGPRADRDVITVRGRTEALDVTVEP